MSGGGDPHLEFKWGDHKEIDPASLASINSTYVRMGIKSIDEARAEIGLDPLGMEHAIFTGNGCIFIEELKDPEIRKQLMGLGAQPGGPGAPGGAPGAGAGSGFNFMAQLMGSTADHESKDAGRRNTVLDLESQDEGAVNDMDLPALGKRLPYSGYP